MIDCEADAQHQAYYKLLLRGGESVGHQNDTKCTKSWPRCHRFDPDELEPSGTSLPGG